MKTLILVRHAQAVEYAAQGDYYRNLTGKGKRDADKVAKHLASIGVSPDLIFSSPANRALETAVIFKSILLAKPNTNLAEVEDLYAMHSTQQMVKFIHAIPDNLNEVVIVGHNPILKEISHVLFEKQIEWFPKSGALSLSFNVQQWNQIQEKSGKINFFTHPKEFIYSDLKKLKKVS